MIKNILITGSNGQLGRELQELVNKQDHNLFDISFYFTDRSSLDITDKNELQNFIELNSIDTIINCAAYTFVDEAENKPELADNVNREAVKMMAELSLEKKIWLIHISTDYVFGGCGHAPFAEDDQTDPQGVYGKTKLAGEKEIQRVNPSNAIIIRTSWIYSNYGSNFIKTILKLGQKRDTINVVCDQIGTPTYAGDLARAILTIIDQKNSSHEEDTSNPVSIYHYGNEGSCSWYDFAKAIFEFSDIKCKVNPIGTEEYPTPAKRPHYSVLNKAKIKEKYKLHIPYWRDTLKSFFKKDSDTKVLKHKIGVIGSGFIAQGLVELLANHKDYELSGILTRTDIHKRTDFPQSHLLTNELDQLIERSDLIVECSGDAIYATDTIDRILKASIPVVTMNSEFHVTTGFYFVDKGLVTEAEGDQPGVLAMLHEEALDMGFKPLVYANIKGFLNENPTREDMEYWAKRSNLSLEMVTSFTDGTKVQIEQVLVANGLGAGLIEEGLVKLPDDDMLHGGSILADRAKELGYPVSDYLLSATLPAGVFLIVEHDEAQKAPLKYYKLGDGPYYVLERTYHLCHLEIIKTIKRVLNGGGVLLNNSSHPKFSVATIAKKDLYAGEKISHGIGSFDVRGIAVNIKNNSSHIPIGLFTDATLLNDIKKGEIIRFDDVDIPDSLALNIWNNHINKLV